MRKILLARVVSRLCNIIWILQGRQEIVDSGDLLEYLGRSICIAKRFLEESFVSIGLMRG